MEKPGGCVGGKTLLLLGSIAVSLLTGELALRMASGQPILSPFNFRDRAINRENSGASIYDPDLGWTLRPGLTGHGMNTLEYGIRTNGRGESAIRPGGVLAVGDSFTAGSEVSDADTWPAQLERLVGKAALNAGVGGFGTDQIVMRAETLLASARPEVLLVGFLSQDILRGGYSSYGAPKPYYTVEDDRMVLHNSPVPGQPSAPTNSFANAIKSAAGYSFSIHLIMMKFARDSWLSTPQQAYTRITNDPSDVTCRLLQRLKARTDALGIRTLLVMQYGADAVRTWSEPSDDAVPVKACAQAMGIQVVDEFDSLKALYRTDPEALKAYYVMTGNVYGHMSALGNRHVAGLIAGALAEPPILGRAVDYTPERVEPGEGVNLLRSSESLKRALAGMTFATFSQTDQSMDGQRIYRLAASGGRSEHYVLIAPVRADAGAYTASLSAKPDGGGCLRVQLYDRERNGMLADFDLRRKTAVANPIGAASVRRAAVVPADDGWLRLSISARLRVGDPQVLLQLSDKDCKESFEPNRESVLVRGLQLERGQSASSYQPTSGPGSPGFMAGDGRNRIARPEALETMVGQGEIAALMQASHSNPRTYRLSATGPASEHYVGIDDIAAEAGPYTLSLEARPSGTTRLRLQILDDGNNGAIGDYDLSRRDVSATKTGSAQYADAEIQPAAGDWQRLTLTASLHDSRARVLLQIMDREGGGSFAPAGEAVELRAVQLERGHSASSYPQ